MEPDCINCCNFKVCEGLPAPMGWCGGTFFNVDVEEEEMSYCDDMADPDYSAMHNEGVD